MNENHQWQKDLRKVEQAVKKQRLDRVAKAHVSRTLAYVVGTQSCVQESLGQCNNCPIALVALGLMRWTHLGAGESVELVQPLCHSLAGASESSLHSISHLQNLMASQSLGQKRNEDWRD